MKKAKSKTRTKAASTTAAKTKAKEYRPNDVIKTNGTIQLDPGLLQMKTAKAIAKSLKQSAEKSNRLKHSPFHSAMSSLNFLISHVEVQKVRLEAAKKELRHLYGEDDTPGHTEQAPNPPEEFAKQKSAPKS